MTYRPNFSRIVGFSVVAGGALILQQGAAMACDTPAPNNDKPNDAKVDIKKDHVKYLENKYNKDADAKKDKTNNGKSDKAHENNKPQEGKKDGKGNSENAKANNKPTEGPKDKGKKDKDKGNNGNGPCKETCKDDGKPEVTNPEPAKPEVKACPVNAKDRVVSYTFTINSKGGYTTLQGNIRPGDTVKVDFVIAEGCDDTELTFASYDTASPTFEPSLATQQKLHDFETGKFDAGAHSMDITIPNCFYQTDFVVGGVLKHLGPEGSNNFYGDARMIDTAVGGKACKKEPKPEEPKPSVTPEAPKPAEELPTIEQVTMPEPTTTPVVTEVLSEQVIRTTTTTRQLARTGVDSGQLALLGGSLLLMGAAFSRVGRRMSEAAA